MKNATILNRSISNISGDFRRNLPYILFTANVFLVIAFYFTMAGMHEDGLIYTGLTQNSDLYLPVNAEFQTFQDRKSVV